MFSFPSGFWRACARLCVSTWKLQAVYCGRKLQEESGIKGSIKTVTIWKTIPSLCKVRNVSYWKDFSAKSMTEEKRASGRLMHASQWMIGARCVKLGCLNRRLNTEEGTPSHFSFLFFFFLFFFLTGIAVLRMIRKDSLEIQR